LFIDGGGYDQYLVAPEELPFTGDTAELEAYEFCGNGMSWHQGDNAGAPYAYSVGIDAE